MNPEHRSALRTLCAAFEGQPLNWAVTGSLGFLLHGIAVEVHDIDLQTDRASAYAIQRLFADAMIREVRFSESEHFAHTSARSRSVGSWWRSWAIFRRS